MGCYVRLCNYTACGLRVLIRLALLHYPLQWVTLNQVFLIVIPGYSLMPVSAFKATRYDRNQNLFLELRFFHAGLRGFFTGCGLRQQMHLEIINAFMDLFLINCIIFKVTKTFHTGLMNNLILL